LERSFEWAVCENGERYDLASFRIVAKYSRAARVLVPCTASRVETQFSQSRDELHMSLERFRRRHFDRDLDQIIAIRKPPLFESHFMRKGLVFRLPAQHPYRAQDAHLSELDPTVGELCQEALLVVGEHLDRVS
jgi:hypothetical protein